MNSLIVAIGRSRSTFVLTVLLLLTAPFSSAQVPGQSFYWRPSNNSEFRGPDPTSACMEGLRLFDIQSPFSWTFSHVGASNPPREDARLCYALQAGITNPQPYSYSAVNRYGTPVCDPPAVYDPVTGTCNAEHLCPSGPQGWFKTGSSIPDSFCFEGCSLTSGSTGACATDHMGVTTCSSEYSGTGTVCGSNDGNTKDDSRDCPTGMKNISADPNVKNCTAKDPPKPTCWAGSHNVSTDPTIAICVGDTPENKPPQPDESKSATTTKTQTKEATRDQVSQETTRDNTNGTTTTTTTITRTERGPDGTTTTKTITVVTHDPPAEGSANEPGYGGGAGGGPRECGTPGLPKCQIDETGTPTGIGSALDDATNKMNQAGEDIKGGANEAASDTGKDASLGGWLPELPQGSCSNFSVPEYNGDMHEVDICKYVPYVTAGFELLWCAFFAFAIMALVSSATSKSHA